MPRLNASGWKKGDLRIWSGELDNIPKGWELAQEMVDHAVVGAGGAYSKGQKFGADSRTPAKPSVSVSIANHTLSTSRMPAHRHRSYSSNGTLNANSRLDQNRGGGSNKNYSDSENEGSSGAHNHGASVSVGNVGSVDTRQKSIAVIWIRKL